MAGSFQKVDKLFSNANRIKADAKGLLRKPWTISRNLLNTTTELISLLQSVKRNDLLLPQADSSRIKPRVCQFLSPYSLQAWKDEFEFVALDDLRKDSEDKVTFFFFDSIILSPEKQLQCSESNSACRTDDIGEAIKLAKQWKIPLVYWHNRPDLGRIPERVLNEFDFIFSVSSNSTLSNQQVERKETNEILSLEFGVNHRLYNPVRSSSKSRNKDISVSATFGSTIEELSTELSFKVDLFKNKVSLDKVFSQPLAPCLSLLAVRETSPANLIKVADVSVTPITPESPFPPLGMLESIACGIPAVASDPLRQISGSQTDQTQSPTLVQTLKMVRRSPNFLQRSLHVRQRELWSNHTYSVRARRILGKIGCPSTPPDKSVSIICSTNRPEQLRFIIKQSEWQTHRPLELLICLHGVAPLVDLGKLKEKASIPVSFFRLPRSKTLGDCLNELVEHSNGNYIAKFDDDDIYLENYLVDQLNALDYSSADIVGKACTYYYLEHSNDLILRWPEKEHRYSDFVAGATITGRASVFRENPFETRNQGEDTAFLRNVKKSGHVIYSADRFNFIVRRGSLDNHTWKISDLELLSGAIFATKGLNIDHVKV